VKKHINISLNRKEQGVTLIELLVTLVVLSILLTIAVPGFQNFMRSNRLTSVANEMASALNLARSEAIRRGKTVTVCKSNANAASPTCDGTNWTDGWLVFVGTSGAGDAVSANHIKVGQINATGVQISTGTTSFDSGVSFSANGASNASDTFSISITCNGDDQNRKREVDVGNTGRVSVKSVSC
jgi:type IV fimbrial biogenesis protein FimT